MTPAERAAKIARESANRIETNIAREWWTVRKPGEEPIPVFFCPAQTQAEVLRWYAGCGVVAM